MKNIIFNIVYNPKSEKYGLIADDFEGEISIAKEWAEGNRHIMVSVSDARTTEKHRKFFGIINAFCDAAPEAAVSELTGTNVSNMDTRLYRDLVRKALLIECNYVEPTIVYLETEYKGEPIKIREVRMTAKSVSFKAMGEKEFNEMLQCITSKMYDILRESGWEEINIDLLFKSI